MSPSGKVIAAGLFAASGLFCAAPGALAQDSGTFHVIVVFTHDYTSIEHATATVFGGPLQGVSVVLENSGGPWVAGAKSRHACLLFGQRRVEGVDLKVPCTDTDAAGDQWFTLSRRRAGDVDEGGGGDGMLELMGGTGKYAGITGNCSYTVEYLPDDWASLGMHCKWNRS